MKVVKYIEFEIDGVNHYDYPDYVDAFIVSATALLENGEYRPATETELEILNEDRELVYDLINAAIY